MKSEGEKSVEKWLETKFNRFANADIELVELLKEVFVRSTFTKQCAKFVVVAILPPLLL